MSFPNQSGFINGVISKGQGDALSVENPSTGENLASITGLDIHQIEAAINAARAAFDSDIWSGLTPRERATSLQGFIAALESRSQQLIDLMVAEAGCPRSSGVMFAQVLVPLKHARDVINLYLDLPEIEDNPLPLQERISPLGQAVQSMRRYTPVGVVSAIAAYNFPFYTAMWKVIPALITGNTMVLRPSPLTPLSAMLLAEAAVEAGLPAGVLNIVIEGGLEGARLMTTHPSVDMVAFTGSTGVGEQIMAQAAPTMKRLQLELGGKSAQIFLPDAVDQVLAATMGVCLAHAGQGCALGTRIFVPNDKKEEILQQLAAVLGTIKIGSADSKETQLGPVISAAQVERCKRYVKLAEEHGGRVVFGGRVPEGAGQGYFFEPTLLDLPDNGNPAAQDEIFGPVVSVIGYRDTDHAVAMANDSRFGLSGYVYGKDKRAALDVALRIKSGTVNVNGSVLSAYASSGGQRSSGIGRERGVEGLRIYQQMTCINLGA